MGWIHRALSLRSKITASFTVIVIGGTAASTLIGSRIITDTLVDQAQQRARQGLDAAHVIYAERLSGVRAAVERMAAMAAVVDAGARGSAAAAAAALRDTANERVLDFQGFVDEHGRVPPDDPTEVPPVPAIVAQALTGASAASTEIVPRQWLLAGAPQVAERAQITVTSVGSADSVARGNTTDGLVLVAAAPVRSAQHIVGAVYGGVLLNRNYEIVDRVKHLLYGAETYRGGTIGTVSIFLRDVRVATNVMNEAGQRAIGTRVSAPVRQAVLEEGRRWDGRAFVVNDWYVASYEPIRNGSGSVIGILYSGILEQPFLAARTEVMLTFLGVCVVGLLVVFVLTYLLTRTTIRPLEEMAMATRQIAAGQRGVRVRTGARDEIGVLAVSFNNMLDALQTTERELENWGRTLEVKVQERTDELVAVQARMAESEKLASIGRLAAGVAHGVNNPLGGILSLTMLALEDCGPDHPLRSDLETVVKQTLRCREIVKGLLDFSRQTDARPSSLDVNAIVEGSLSLLERQALFHNIKTIRRFQDGLPPVLMDPGQLQEVIINIVLNAVDAMDENGVLTVETATDPTGPDVVIRITDTGKGIPPDAMPLIFEPFFTTKKVGRGTGLGLAIVHGVVSKARGTVDVASKPGQTTFSVRLPVAERDVKDEPIEDVGCGTG